LTYTLLRKQQRNKQNREINKLKKEAIKITWSESVKSEFNWKKLK
jgi:predicted transcriptional regulator